MTQDEDDTEPERPASLRPRDLRDTTVEGGSAAGFIYLLGDDEGRWPADDEAAMQRLPDDFLEASGGVVKVKRDSK
ncbi:MAG: hypothetical protein ACRD29_11420 [Acidimicrobiales bacterium]